MGDGGSGCFPAATKDGGELFWLVYWALGFDGLYEGENSVTGGSDIDRLADNRIGISS
jgi:hypothetical protein